MRKMEKEITELEQVIRDIIAWDVTFKYTKSKQDGVDRGRN
jgi:hypothetical protein